MPESYFNKLVLYMKCIPFYNVEIEKKITIIKMPLKRIKKTKRQMFYKYFNQNTQKKSSYSAFKK